jgi:hypothetical protein
MDLCSTLRKPAGHAKGSKMQRQKILSIVLIVPFSTYSAQASKEHLATGKEQISSKIWIEHTFLSRPGNETTLHVSIDNASSGDDTITAMTGHLQAKSRTSSGILSRGGESYWSPVDVSAKTALKPVSDSKGGLTYPEGKLVIKAKSNVEFTIELSALDWNKDISASLPSSRLFAVVPDGAYELYFNLEARDANGRFTIESNKMSIAIRRAKKSR